VVKPVLTTLAPLAVLVPAEAWACPSCAGNPGNSALRMVLIGLMILAPYVASVVVIRIIRKGEAEMSRGPRPGSSIAGEH
jgi:hypothetical protein